MTKQLKIDEAEDNVTIKEINLSAEKNAEKFYKKGFKASLVIGALGAAYFGARLFLGPDVNLEEYATNALQVIDYAAATLVPLSMLAGGITYGTSYLHRKKAEKDLEKAESELEQLVMEQDD